MKNVFITLLASLFIIACTKQSPNKFSQEQVNSLALDSTLFLTVNSDLLINVDLNPFLQKQDYSFSDLIEEVQLVPLETKEKSLLAADESLLSSIYKIIVTSTHIYIHDKFKGGGLVIFDREGKFIKRITNGQGPGELVRLYDMDFDAEKKEFIAYIHSFLMFYTPAGEFIRREKLPFGFYNFLVTSSGYVFKTLDGQGNEHLQTWANNTLLVTDKDFKLKSSALPVVVNDINYSGYHYLYTNNDNIAITQKFVDTIYQYVEKTNQLKASYALDYHKKQLPSIYLQGTSKDFFHAIEDNDYYYFLGEYYENDSHNAFILNNNYKGFTTIVYRDKETGHLQGGTFGKYEKEGEIPSMTLPKTTSDGYFIGLHYRNDKETSFSDSSVLTSEDREKIKNLTVDDNPVLVFYKLRRF